MDVCYLCGRTIEDCRLYLIEIIDNNFDQFRQYFLSQPEGHNYLQDQDYKKFLKEQNKRLKLFITEFKNSLNEVDNKNLAKWMIDNIQKIQNDCINYKKNKSYIFKSEKSERDFSFSTLYLALSCFVNHIEKDFFNKYGDWDKNKLEMAPQFNYQFKEGEATLIKLLINEIFDGKTPNDARQKWQPSLTHFESQYLVDTQDIEEKELIYNYFIDIKMRHEVICKRYGREGCPIMAIPICSICDHVLSQHRCY